MPRKKQELVFLGALTVKILRGVSPEVSGWLVRALLDWTEDGNLPETIPPECLGAWIAIRDESERVCDARRQFVDAGRAGADKTNGERAANARRTDSERAANGRQTDGERAANGRQTDGERAANGRQTDGERAANGRQTDGERAANARQDEDEEKKGENKPKSSEGLDSSARVREAGGPSSSTSLPSESKRLLTSDFPRWAMAQKDAVTVALAAAGEGRDKRRVYGSFVKKCGRALFLDIVCSFQAELAAGERPENPGAALVARLKEGAEAHAAMEALAQ
jgi:hypothetical protein